VSPSLRRRLGGRGQAPSPLRIPAPDGLLDVLRDGPAPLEHRPVDADALHVAWLVPQFRKGSGGHSTISNVVRGLEALGHRCSVWVLDEEGRHEGASDEELGELWRRFFGPMAAPVRLGAGGWDGADVAMATGWQTVPRTLLLPGVAARTYFVQDHEPEFYPTSASREWAAWTYRQGLHCIAASAWLAEKLRREYGASAGHFDLGVDHDTYKLLPIQRHENLVLFYARAVTARRAVPLGALALEELHRRRGDDVQIVLFGESRPLDVPFPHRNLGVLEPDDLAQAYNAATVGLVLSMTNPSLIPTEMLACGLPVVDLATDAMTTAFGPDGPITLATPDPLALCSSIEQLLDDFMLRADRTRSGIPLTAERTWDAAAAAVAAELRRASRA
jgi:glycosyltransferase involved in cell wall biosynthesis